ncbi:hypothetical protein C241_12750 [Bradyrhizobium lupini HPC(L)]|uniref:Uncharacterized protein n=1 Tax=Bradyrhizobium lupini HPC(L) TaxID=1229491 RepID=A0ABN0HLG3_RHILU|nr:hypothetical protein C241_12750 [Bradyrhizobium lupini HPC(L)]
MQLFEESTIESLRLMNQVSIGILFCLAVKPDNLSPCEGVKFVEVVGPAIDFRNMPYMRVLLSERHWQAQIEIGRHNRSGKPAQDEISEGAVT